MRHASPHALTRTGERRLRLAREAARLMAEGGIDCHQARHKAAIRLGIHDPASLPHGHEIEDALREYQRLFRRDVQDQALRIRREAALRALEFFAPFDARLVGPVLEGTADVNSPVTLHLYTDDTDAVHRFLDEHGIPAQARSRRMRLDRERSADVPVWRFAAEDLGFELSVLPRLALRQAPLPDADEQPVRRASAAQLRKLMTGSPR